MSKSEDDAKSAILNKNGVAMGEVTAAMSGKMQELTKPMQGNYINEVGAEAKAIIEGYLKDVGR